MFAKKYFTQMKKRPNSDQKLPTFSYSFTFRNNHSNQLRHLGQKKVIHEDIKTELR